MVAVRARVCVAMAVALISLAGCTAAPSTDTGLSAAGAEKLLNDVAGVENATVRSRTTLDGFTQHVPTTVKVHLRSGHTVHDDARLADYLIRLLWSVGEVRPTELVVSVSSSDGSMIRLVDGATATGWEPIIGSRDAPVFVVHRLGDEPVRSKLGPWPGPVPPPPLDAIRPLEDGSSAQRSRSANAWIAASIPSVSKDPSALRVK